MRIEFSPTKVTHVVQGTDHMQSYGLMFKVNGQNVFWTSDAQSAPNQIMQNYTWADVIFQDCETGFRSGVHAHYSELKELDPEIKKKMILFHFQPGDKPEPKKDGFNRFASKGDVYLI